VKAGFDLSHNSDATSLFAQPDRNLLLFERRKLRVRCAGLCNFGISGQLNPITSTTATRRAKYGAMLQANCAAWLSSLLLYYSQTIGPTDWHLSTNDWAGFQPRSGTRRSFCALRGLRWEREQFTSADRKAGQSRASADREVTQPGQ